MLCMCREPCDEDCMGPRWAAQLAAMERLVGIEAGRLVRLVVEAYDRECAAR